MTRDNKTKAASVPEKEAPPKNNSTSGEDVSKVKGDGGETATVTSSNYRRGEGQKPVTKAYKENRNAIFAKKRTR